jgi:hypothetical protein
VFNDTVLSVSVGIATTYGLDDQGIGVPSPGGSKNFHFSMLSRPVLGSTERVARALSLGVKRPRPEADHSPPASAAVKKTWIYISTPLYAFVA